MNDIWVMSVAFDLGLPGSDALEAIKSNTSEEFYSKIVSFILDPIDKFEALQIEYEDGYVDVIFLAKDERYTFSYRPNS